MSSFDVNLPFLNGTFESPGSDIYNLVLARPLSIICSKSQISYNTNSVINPYATNYRANGGLN